MKKTAMVLVCVLSLSTLVGCNSAELDKLRDQVVILQQEKEQQVKEITQLKEEIDISNRTSAEKDQKINELENTILDYETKFDISVEDIKFVSEEMYQEGELQGKIYGDFDIVVKIKNNTKETISDIKIVAKTETSYGNYPKAAPKVKTSKLLIEKSIAPEESKEIHFSGFNVDHPESIQELIINIVDKGEIVKVKVPSAFSPDSQE